MTVCTRAHVGVRVEQTTIKSVAACSRSTVAASGGSQSWPVSTTTDAMSADTALTLPGARNVRSRLAMRDAHLSPGRSGGPMMKTEGRPSGEATGSVSCRAVVTRTEPPAEAQLPFLENQRFTLPR